MKILVPIKQVTDPDQNRRLRLELDGRRLETSGLDRLPNPFDEYALESALRLTENAQTPKNRLGDVVAVTLGNAATEVTLRSALALGATKAIRIDTSDDELDAHLVAKGIAHLARVEAIDLVLMGKQTVDGDGNEVAQRVAANLDWPQITCASTIEELENGTLLARREVDGGTLRLRVSLPVIISVDLRIVLPDAVRSRHTPRDFASPVGVRYASLPSIVMAKRKPLTTHRLSDIVDCCKPVLTHAKYALLFPRRACHMVGSVEELVRRLTDEVQVL